MRHASVVENLSPIGLKPQNEAQAREPRPVTIPRDHVSQYLLGLSAALCVEVARTRICCRCSYASLCSAPRTIEALRTQKRAA